VTLYLDTPEDRERLAVYLEELERRVTLLEAQVNPPAPDPLEVGTDVFRQTSKIKDKALKRR
jgi:hypothetical protein